MKGHMPAVSSTRCFSNIILFANFVTANSFIGLGTAYRNRTAVYHGTLLHTAVRTTVYRNSIKLTVIVNLSAAIDIYLIYMPTSHSV